MGIDPERISTLNHSQLILPSTYQESALSYVHNDMGHLGRDGTLGLLHEQYFWVGNFIFRMVTEILSSLVKSDDCSDEGIVILKPRTVIPVPTTRRSRELSVTPQIDQSSLAKTNRPESVVHLDNGEVVSSGTGEILNDKLVGHCS